MSDSDDEGPATRRPKTATDLIIDAALAEEKARKEAKKAGGAVPVKKKDGKTLEEIEKEEGGPVKESLVGMAQVKRALNRKDKDQDKKLQESTDVPIDTQAFEEKREVEEEDGQKFTAFNLDEERETGYFDDDGNYVERKEQPDPSEKDAWMTSDDAKVVSDEVRAKIEARRKAEEEASKVRVAPLTDRQIATMKAELSSNMKADETLAQAMKRLGSGSKSQRAMGKREKQKLQQQQQDKDKAASASGGGGGGATSGGPQQTADVLVRMTEIADRLLLEGEVDIYDNTKEDFDKAAAMWLPKSAPATAPTNAPTTRPLDEDSDDDMFAENDAPKPAKKQKTEPAAAAVSAPAAVGTAASARPAATPAQGTGGSHNSNSNGAMVDDGVDYGSWPLKELKRFVKERGGDPDQYVEKSELVQAVKRLATQGPQTAGGAGAAGAPPAFPAPPGYAFDPTSGYFYNAENGMYFDGSSGCYYNSGHWYTLNTATGSFVPMQG